MPEDEQFMTTTSTTALLEPISPVKIADALAWLEDEPDLYDDVGPTTPPDDIQSSDALAWLEDEPDLYDDVGPRM